MVLDLEKIEIWTSLAGTFVSIVFLLGSPEVCIDLIFQKNFKLRYSKIFFSPRFGRYKHKTTFKCSQKNSQYLFKKDVKTKS